jgi:serine protease
MATALRGVLGAATVEPDLGTGYYECEREGPPPGTPESADYAFWFWIEHDTAASPAVLVATGQS